MHKEFRGVRGSLEGGVCVGGFCWNSLCLCIFWGPENIPRPGRAPNIQKKKQKESLVRKRPTTPQSHRSVQVCQLVTFTQETRSDLCDCGLPGRFPTGKWSPPTGLTQKTTPGLWFHDPGVWSWNLPQAWKYEKKNPARKLTNPPPGSGPENTKKNKNADKNTKTANFFRMTP